MFGACLGGLFGVLILKYWSKDFALVFNLAAIPAFLAFLFVLLTLQEKKPHPRQKINFSNIKLFPLDFWILIFLVFIYMLARGCEIFIALHGKEHLGINIIYIPLISLLYNAIYALISYPAGVLSDHYDPFKTLGFGFLVFACAHMMLALVSSTPGFWVAIILWGMQLGILQNLLISLIAKSLPENLRGTGFGMFYLASALALSLSGILSGFLAQYAGVLTLFGLSACIALGGAFFCWRLKWLKRVLSKHPS
jgi:MFS family permease